MTSENKNAPVPVDTSTERLKVLKGIDCADYLHMALAAERDALDAENAALRARMEALEEALTPSGETKSAYISEVPNHPACGHTVCWTAIKDVMRLIRDRAALAPPGPAQGKDAT